MHVLQPRKLAGFRRTVAEGCENLEESTTFSSTFSVLESK